jgi:ketosteroid isomerase-like protein
MKTPTSCLLLLACIVTTVPAAAQRPEPSRMPSPAASDEQVVREVRAADDERVAASLAADRRRLLNVYSDALKYQHSNGVVDTSDQLIEKIVSGRTKYKSMTYKDRTFTRIAPEIVLMSGRVHFVAVSGGQDLDTELSFLAVWRLENGRWRFLAWQSARIPPPAAK